MNEIWVRLKCECGVDCSCDDGEVISEDGNSVVTCKRCDGNGFLEGWRDLSELGSLIKMDVLQKENLDNMFTPKELEKT